jgi:hypothetical protein
VGGDGSKSIDAAPSAAGLIAAITEGVANQVVPAVMSGIAAATAVAPASMVPEELEPQMETPPLQVRVSVEK